MVLEMCIENGISLGLSRAFKHDDKPDMNTIKSYVEKHILNEIYEWFDVENNENSYSCKSTCD